MKTAPFLSREAMSARFRSISLNVTQPCDARLLPTPRLCRCSVASSSEVPFAAWKPFACKLPLAAGPLPFTALRELLSVTAAVGLLCAGPSSTAHSAPVPSGRPLMPGSADADSLTGSAALASAVTRRKISSRVGIAKPKCCRPKSLAAHQTEHTVTRRARYRLGCPCATPHYDTLHTKPDDKAKCFQPLMSKLDWSFALPQRRDQSSINGITILGQNRLQCK